VRRPIDRKTGEIVPESGGPNDRLRRFPGRHGQEIGGDPGSLQGLDDPAGMRIGHRLVGHHDRPLNPGRLQSLSDSLEKAAAAVDVVGAISPAASQRNPDGGHGQVALTRSRSAGVTVITRANPVC
jgi:hypothetical protein